MSTSINDLYREAALPDAIETIGQGGYGRKGVERARKRLQKRFPDAKPSDIAKVIDKAQKAIRKGKEQARRGDKGGNRETDYTDVTPSQRAKGQKGKATYYHRWIATFTVRTRDNPAYRVGYNIEITSSSPITRSQSRSMAESEAEQYKDTLLGMNRSYKSIVDYVLKFIAAFKQV